MEDYKKELKEILPLLESADEESRKLGYHLFQTSKFRKYIRNKCYAYKERKTYIRFPLDPLINNGEDDFFTKNDAKINHAKIVIEEYLKNKIVIYDYSVLKRAYNK